MKSIAVFCGSRAGANPAFAQVATQVGTLLGQQNINLVYGGGHVGLMGAVANGALQAGGTVTGVIPHFLDKLEVAHQGLTKLIMVDTMHERKMMMNDLSQGFMILPGGFGTMEEFFEVITWAQLGLHTKPIGLLNVSGYYDHLIAMVDSMVTNDLLRPAIRNMMLVANTLPELMQLMQNYKAPNTPNILKEDQT